MEEWFTFESLIYFSPRGAGNKFLVILIELQKNTGFKSKEYEYNCMKNYGWINNLYVFLMNTIFKTA